MFQLPPPDPSAGHRSSGSVRERQHLDVVRVKLSEGEYRERTQKELDVEGDQIGNLKQTCIDP